MSAPVKHVSQPPPHARAIGRYVLYDQIGSGGMATVHFGRLRGPAGFARTVAIKRLHPHLATNPQFASVFISEARLAARVRHPNVVSLLDVIALESGELLLVMEYVHGETLAALLGSARLGGGTLPPALVSAVMVGALHGLHAAHEAVNERGAPLGLVHGDVSPRNVIVDVEGGARVLDFGVAKIGPGAAQGLSRLGTPGYMSPEKVHGDRFDRRADVFSAGAVLWEMLCLRRLFPRADRPDAERFPVPPPSSFNAEVSPALEAVVLRALCADKEERFPTARAFAAELERACPPATSQAVSAWVASTRGSALERRARELARIEAVSVAELLEAGVEARLSGGPAGRLPEPPTAARAVPEPRAPEPTIVELPAVEEERPTVVDTSGPPPGRVQAEEAPTVCEPRSTARVLVHEPVTAQVAADPARVARTRLVRVARRLSPSARSVLPAVALLAAMYAAAALDGKPASAPIRASAAAPVVQPQPRAPEKGPPICAGRSVPAPDVAVTTTPEPSAPRPAPTAEPPPSPAPQRSAGPRPLAAVDRGPSDAATAIVGLNRRAIAAYEQLEGARAMRLLGEGLRLCPRAGLQRGDLEALTHLNMGIVLAGGFKQRGLAVQEFRRARSIRPGIEPSGRLVSPEITAAFAEAL